MWRYLVRRAVPLSAEVWGTPLSSACCSGSSSLSTSLRLVQFEQTSATMNAVRDTPLRRRNAEPGIKWITKSTKDYMKEGDSRIQAAPGLLVDHRKGTRRSLDQREAYKEVRDAAEGRVEQELVRIRDERGRRWRKSLTFFKRQGKTFMIFYAVAYFGTLFLLYVGFASDVLKKEAAFEYMFFFLGRYIDKDTFYARIERWDSQVNLGFAFVLNEMLELVRFPLVLFFFYQLRPLFGRTHRGRRKTIFRANAAES